MLKVANNRHLLNHEQSRSSSNNKDDLHSLTVRRSKWLPSWQSTTSNAQTLATNKNLDTSKQLQHNWQTFIKPRMKHNQPWRLWKRRAATSNQASVSHLEKLKVIYPRLTWDSFKMTTDRQTHSHVDCYIPPMLHVVSDNYADTVTDPDWVLKIKNSAPQFRQLVMTQGQAWVSSGVHVSRLQWMKVRSSRMFHLLTQTCMRKVTAIKSLPHDGFWDKKLY